MSPVGLCLTVDAHIGNTIFKRKIIIEDSPQNPATVEKTAKVEISWQEKSGPKTIQAELRLFNWK